MSAPVFVFTVRQLTKYIRALLERDKNLQAVWVRGEISDLTLHSSGHIYFSLKDENTRLRCVMFRNEAAGLLFRPDEGMGVLAAGRIAVYETAGQYQLIVEQLSAEGAGALFLAFEALKKKLAAEGLFEAERKRPLPRFPSRIALLTSPTGAVLHDLQTVIGRRWPQAELLLIPTPVQGAEAAAGIVNSLRRLASCAVDLAILARGGGAPEELACFNDEAVARAIVACPIPIVSAVGHETDFTIADFVADLRAPTPSAAGEIVVPDRAEVAAHIQHLRARLASSLSRKLETAKRELSLLSLSRALRYPQEIVNLPAQRLDDVLADMNLAMKQKLQTDQHRLAQITARLESLSPQAVLRRGYAVVRKLPAATLVKSINQLAPADRVEINLADGKREAEIKKASPGN
jgi:exodeoxyribonuclease VII large subunit